MLGLKSVRIMTSDVAAILTKEWGINIWGPEQNGWQFADDNF